ncbi:MAG: right-handed parallel beta-helix repeat-containing protein [Xanthomonadales bacterium]|nr:right-handed parallel beta-helix repeat-containing protein [Xanthomonadales bacterium]
MKPIRSILAGLPIWLAALPAVAQTTASLIALEGYGNLETAGVVVTISGDSDRDASLQVEWRRSGEAAYRLAHPGVRFDATHFAGSLFGLAPGSAHELRVTLADPDGVSGAAVQLGSFATRADVLVEPTLRTLYVRPDGNDGNDGLTPASAVRTIQRGADLAQAGDVVAVADGVYRESVTVPRSGTALQPIVFRGLGDAVLLDGGDAAIAQGVSWIAMANGVHRRTLGFATGHVSSDQGRLYRYGSLAELQALAAGAPGGYFFDGSDLYLKFADASTPAARTLHVARFDSGFVLDGRSHVRIENFAIRHFGSGDYGKGVYLRFSSDCIVRNNRMHEIGAAGVWVKGGARHRIEDNAFSDSSIPGWPWELTKGSSAENNGVVFTDNPGRGHIVRRNQFSGTFNGIGPCGGSIGPDGITTEVDVYRNRFRDHNDDALEPEGYCANLRLFENAIRDSHMAFAVAPAAPGPTFLVRNTALDTGSTRTSQVDGYGASALKINSGYPTPIGPLLLYHNTFYTRAPATDSILLLDPGASTWLRSRNNIIAGTRYALEKINPIALDLDHDLLHSSDPARFVRWQGVAYASLLALQVGAGAEANGRSGAPQLVAPDAGDFRPAASSPAIDGGVVIAGINDGFAGAAPDIGAVERDDAALLFADSFE